MSAESSRRVPRKGSVGQVVLPQPVTDPSLIDSVAGFIQEVVPQAYSSNAGDSREAITWVRVQQADINDPALYPDTGEQDGVPPLLLALGYGSGVQVWVVPASGEAREVLSWSQGSVRTLCVLPSPEPRLPLRQDLYRHKRPLVAMVDNAGPGPQFCSVSFISLRDGDQVKSIKFSHQVWDVVANRRSVVVTLAERIAVFDAATLEDSVVVTTCYPNPDVNPVALGTRWLAYADRRLVSQWRSLGGCHSEGPQSVTATVFHAAKCLGKGLRDFSETVASSLTGGSPENTHFHSHAPHTEPTHKGVVTVLDIETKVSKDANEEDHQAGAGRILAHFNAHHEPIVALSFDPSGMLLVSADKRGHRFHVFRINTHPCTPTLAYVQHLYILHRGDTTARIQDIAFSADSRWVAISSMRGTTHVFPITPYGGAVGVRTHTTPHVVNKLSRFHRSAGLTDDGRNSPVLWESPPGGGGGPPAHPTPTAVPPLAQVRRLSALAPPTEDSIVKVAAVFGAPRAPSLPPHGGPRVRRSMDSLYIMACNGALVQYDLDPRHLSGISKEKVCDDTGIELNVEARAQWILQRPPYSSALHPPLPCTNPLLNPAPPDPPTPTDPGTDDERWLSQVEIVTHAGPHRRLWMGPQFTFITLSSNNEVGDTLDINKQVVRSNPVNMPLKQPFIIESGSCSSLELSPNMVELVYKTDCSWSCRLREDLAEAMLESPATRNTGVKGVVRREPVIERQVNPLGSVVTLTAQLNFPANLHSDDGKVTVVGTETKKITLESRLNKMVNQSLLSEYLLSDTSLDPSLHSQAKISEIGASSLDLVKNNCKIKQKSNEHYDIKGSKKVLAEVDENISKLQRKSEEKDGVQETPEKRGKNGKAKRKISKGEKNKPKAEIESKSVEDIFIVPSDNLQVMEMNISSNEIEMPICDAMLQSTGDIEMQLREASAEKDIEETIQESEDSKGRKRSLDNTLETKTIDIENELLFENSVQTDKEELKENDKTSSRQRKKSRMNDQDAWPKRKLDDKHVEEKPEQNEGDKVSKAEEKPKGKKKRSKKSNQNQTESLCDELQSNVESMSEMKKADESDIEPLTLETSSETLCLEMSHDIQGSETSNVKVLGEAKIDEDITNINLADTEKSTIEDDKSLNFDNDIPENNIVEEKNSTTDDELRGFESDLLVKDSTWSPENSPEKDIDIIMDDRDSDKEIDKIKNDETTDKDSSDDCQPIIVKADSKQAHKRGKNRKLTRKNRELEQKALDNESKHEEITFKEDIIKSENTFDDKNRKESSLNDDVDESAGKIDSEEEDMIVESKKNIKSKSMDESFPELKLSSEGVKRRVRKRETLDKEQELKDFEAPDLDIPKRSWSSIVSSNNEDPNGNIPKPEDLVPVRSWSSIAASPAKPRAQDTDVIKTNSVEDRDSVYESCNDSVGEEVEPTQDSLGSCYFESESKDETTEDSLTASQYKQEETSSESKHGSSVEDKSNTDSGEKDDLICSTQISNKKSKKQKKKKR